MDRAVIGQVSGPETDSIRTSWLVKLPRFTSRVLPSLCFYSGLFVGTVMSACDVIPRAKLNVGYLA